MYGVCNDDGKFKQNCLTNITAQKFEENDDKQHAYNELMKHCPEFYQDSTGKRAAFWFFIFSIVAMSPVRARAVWKFDSLSLSLSPSWKLN